MNTDIIVHPRLQHYGLITAHLDAMLDWYRIVLGMTVNHRADVPPEAVRHGAPFSAFAFVSNDERDHRVVFFQMPNVSVDPDRRRHTGLQHVAFECPTLDDLLGTYVRLKGSGIVPVWAADHGVGISFYYEDPDRNIVELNVNNYSDVWTATEHIRQSRPHVAWVDPEKLLAAREEGLSPWQVHERATAGALVPDTPYDPAAHF